MHVGGVVGELAVDSDGPVVDIGAQVRAVGTDDAQAIGDRVEVDACHDAVGKGRGERALLGGGTGSGVDGDDLAVAGDAVKHAVGRADIDAVQALDAGDVHGAADGQRLSK